MVYEGLIKFRQKKKKPEESQHEYITRAARFARRVFRKLSAHEYYRGFHESFLVSDALETTESAFPDLGTFGVESIPKGNNKRSPEIHYLNTGDAYINTVLFVNGRFVVGNWGYYVERGNYD